MAPRCRERAPSTTSIATDAPQQTVSLFDYVVGERQQLRWHFEAERLGGLEVDHELEFGGSHDRQVGRLFALENPPGVDAGLAVGIRNAGPVAHQSAGHGGLAPYIARRQRMAGRQCGEPFPMGVHERAGTDEQRARAALNEGCKGCFDVALATDIENDELLPDGLRRDLYVSSVRLGRRAAWVQEHANCCRLGRELTQQLQSLRP